jgi:CTP synthase (UTP-ammonia lyase)
VALTYILEPKTLGEQKSKAAQLGIKQLLQLGIQPDIIACRCENPVTEQARQKMSVFGNVPFDRVFSMHDSASIYSIPAMLRDCGIDFQVLRMLKLEDRIQLRHERKQWARWCDFTDKISKETHAITIGITGKYTSVRDSYASILNALEHAGIHLGTKVQVKWIDTTVITDANAAEHLKDVDGIIVPGGFGTRGWEGKISCVRFARDTLAQKLFGKVSSVRRRFRHRYEVDPDYITKLEENGMVFSGKAPNQPIMQILELPELSFFMGTQSHPELTSRPMRPSPMFVALTAAARKRKYADQKVEEPLSAVEKIAKF